MSQRFGELKRFCIGLAVLFCLAAVVILLLFINGGAGQAGSEPGELESSPYIVGFISKPGPDQEQLIHSKGGEVRLSFKCVPAISAELPAHALEDLKNNSAVAYIHPDVQVGVRSQVLPWGIDRIKAPQVWETTTGTGIKTAVIDTGIAYDHPDLEDNYMGGWNFIDNNSDAADDHGHGTHVAGIAAAVDNDIGVVGAAHTVDLYGLKVLNHEGNGSTSDVIAALDWCIDNGMQVVNMSFGYEGEVYLEALEQACDAAYAAGLLLVSSAGNSGHGGSEGNIGQPARYESVIAVTAIDQDELRAGFSNTGPEAGLCAPGVGINSTYYDPDKPPPQRLTYKVLNGTSMAAPHVAGSAALLWAYEGALTNTEIRDTLKETARDLGSPGHNWEYGYGLVDVREALDSITAGELPEPLTIREVEPDLSSPQETGTAVRWEVAAEGGEAPYEYAFYVYRYGTRIHTRWYSGANYLEFAPEYPGEYVVKAFVKDDSGALVWQDSGIFIFQGDYLLEISEVSADLSSPRETGTVIRWEVSAVGGQTPYEYAFYIFLEGERIKTIWYGAQNYIDFTGAEPGNYTVRAFVKDDTGALVWRDADTFLFFEEQPLSVYEFEPDLASPRDTGTMVRWEAAGVGGTPPYQYAFYIYRDGERIHTRWYGEGSYIDYAAVDPGDYVVRAFLQDDAGALVWQDSDLFVFQGDSLQPLAIEQVESNLSSPRETGTVVRWEAAAEGGQLPYQYAFYVYLDSERIHTKWYSGENFIDYAAVDPGDYVVRAFLQDDAGALVWRDSPLFEFY